MAAVVELSNNLLIIDAAYEFAAPQFYDFTYGETDEDVRNAELWFETSLSYAPSRTYFLLLVLLYIIFSVFGIFEFIQNLEHWRFLEIF